MDFNPALANPESAPNVPAIFEASPQQATIFDWVQTGQGHSIVIAVAGSGKTTTLIESLARMTGKVTLLAFNKKIADEIKSKLACRGITWVKVYTFHALGWSYWRKAAPDCKIEGFEADNAGYLKATRILEEIRDNEGLECPFIYHGFVKKAMLYAKQRLFGFEINLMDKKAWLDMVSHFDLQEEIADENGDVPDDIDFHVGQALNWTVRALRYSIQIAREVIDYEDMIYMPLVANCFVWQQDWVLVDEAQDTNPARRAFVRKILKPSGRSIWVGDPHQAIYGFTGADAESLDNIKKSFNCVELPLTWTFRCPKEVVKLAQNWVSHIQAAPQAPDGIVGRVSDTKFMQDLVARKFDETLMTDAILCRNNRPLVELALKLIRQGIACHVEGRDIATGLIKLANRWKSIDTLDQLVKRLEEYMTEEVQKLMAKGKELAAETLEDTVTTLLTIIWSLPQGSTIPVLTQKIESMFMDSDKMRRQTLTLSTIHKSKGREWNRVFWYCPNLYQPSKFARQDWQQLQEKNLMYVAATRAKQQLTIVTGTGVLPTA